MSLIIACLYTYGILPQELIMLTDKNWNLVSWSLNVRNFVEGQKDPSGLLLTVVTVRQTERERSVGIQLIRIWLVERFSMIAFAREWSPCVVKQAHLRLRYSVFLNTFRRMCLFLYSSELQQQALMLVPTWFAFRLHMYDHIMVAASLIFMHVYSFCKQLCLLMSSMTPMTCCKKFFLHVWFVWSCRKQSKHV